VLHN